MPCEDVNTRLVLCIGGIAAVLCIVLVLFLIRPQNHAAPFVADPFIEKAFSVKESWSVKTGTRVIIVPHHLVAAKEIASLISAVSRPSVVYIVAPDHFSQGKTTLTMKGPTNLVGDFSTEVARLRVDDAPFVKEHGVYNLLPFMKKAWGNVPMVAVIVRVDASTKDQEELANALTRRLKEDPHALFVASLDFSHYLPADVADFHDVLAEDVLRSVSDEQTEHVEIDSPGALTVALRVARMLDLGDVTIHAHTNSLRILKATLAYESTSHFLASFAPGDIQPRTRRTVLETHEKGIKSQENRLYVGQDEIRDSTSTHEMIGIVYEGNEMVRRFVFPYKTKNGEPELVIAGKPESLLE